MYFEDTKNIPRRYIRQRYMRKPRFSLPQSERIIQVWESEYLFCVLLGMTQNLWCIHILVKMMSKIVPTVFRFSICIRFLKSLYEHFCRLNIYLSFAKLEYQVGFLSSSDKIYNKKVQSSINYTILHAIQKLYFYVRTIHGHSYQENIFE